MQVVEVLTNSDEDAAPPPATHAAVHAVSADATDSVKYEVGVTGWGCHPMGLPCTEGLLGGPACMEGLPARKFRLHAWRA